MIFLLALLPATALTIGGYVALYVSSRSEGGLRTFGKYLGFWAFTLAALVILGALFAAASFHRHGPCPGMWGGRDHCPWAGGGPPPAMMPVPLPGDGSNPAGPPAPPPPPKQ